jgi:predicted membrane-bound mannosyltransferase
VVVVVGQVAGANLGAVYANPQADENHLVQYAQPAGDIRPVMDVFDEAGAAPGGPDVVFYGEYFVDGGPPTVPRKPGCIRWFNALPLPWYVAESGVEVQCAENATALDTTLAAADSPPAVVVARESVAANVSDSLPGYEPHTYLLRVRDTPTTFFVHEDYADRIPGEPDELPVEGPTRRIGTEGHAYSGSRAIHGR